MPLSKEQLQETMAVCMRDWSDSEVPIAVTKPELQTLVNDAAKFAEKYAGDLLALRVRVNERRQKKKDLQTAEQFLAWYPDDKRWDREVSLSSGEKLKAEAAIESWNREHGNLIKAFDKAFDSPAGNKLAEGHRWHLVWAAFRAMQGESVFSLRLHELPEQQPAPKPGKPVRIN